MRRPRRSSSSAFTFTTSGSTGSMNAVRVRIRTPPKCSTRLHGVGLKLAVVTNKKHDFAVDLLARSGLSAWIEVVVGGDACARAKPDPQPLHFACNAVQVDPAQALMVGDSLTDVLAARAAGMPVVCVPYGYNEGRDPHTLPCDAFIDTLAELPGLIFSARVPSAALEGVKHFVQGASLGRRWHLGGDRTRWAPRCL